MRSREGKAFLFSLHLQHNNMFTNKITCLTLFALALSIGSSDACVGSYPTKCCMSGFCNVGPQGSTWPEKACPGGMCKSNPLCADTPSGKRDYRSCSTVSAAAPAPAPTAPAPAPTAPAPAPTAPAPAPTATAPAPTAPAPAPTAPAPAPVLVLADSNPSCSDWAASGQCASNSGYMLASCAFSCKGKVTSPTVASCDQRNVDYSGRQNCCRCENQFARRLRGARKLGLVSSTIGATTSAATTAGQVTVAANSAYNSQLPCC